MSERLLFPSRVLLYGRVVVDLTIGPQGIPEAVPLLGANMFLQQQLANAAAPPQIARIYGFAYEGHYYDLARPALFLVHGPGVNADPAPAGRPADVDLSGVGATAKSFPGDMMVWAYDKGDFSIRLDIETGTLEQILLHVELSTDRLGMTFSGKTVRLRGPLGD